MSSRFDSLMPERSAAASYQPLFEIGRGGMGVVYLAKALGAAGFERLVVLKRLHKHLLQNDEAVRRFLDEARQAATLHHANIVGVQQVCRDDDGYFLVLDYVEGASVEQLLDFAYLKKTRLPVPVVLRIILDVLEGLDAIHNATDTAGQPLRMLHRDISIQNILVGRDGVARITDFGIAKSKAASVSTDKSYLVGKLLYMPREALQRAEPAPTLDVYAVGVVMWIMLAGTDPWPNATEAEIVEHVTNGRIPPLSSAGLTVAPQLEAIVQKACEPDVSKRFQSARQMADEIERVGRGTGWIAVRGEVIETMTSLMGAELDRLKQRIAEAVSGATEPPAGTAVDGKVLVSSKPPMKSGPWTRGHLWGAVAVVLVLVGVLTVGVLMGNRGEAPASGSARKIDASSSRSVVGRQHPAVSDSAIWAQPLPTAASSPAAAPITRSSAVRASSSSPRKVAQKTAPRNTGSPKQKPKPRPAHRHSTKSGSDILRSNPYR